MFHNPPPHLSADFSSQYLAKIHDNNSIHLPTSPVTPPSPIRVESQPFTNPGVRYDGTLTREYLEKLAQNNNPVLPEPLPSLPLPPSPSSLCPPLPHSSTPSPHHHVPHLAPPSHASPHAPHQPHLTTHPSYPPPSHPSQPPHPPHLPHPPHPSHPSHPSHPPHPSHSPHPHHPHHPAHHQHPPFAQPGLAAIVPPSAMNAPAAGLAYPPPTPPIQPPPAHGNNPVSGFNVPGSSSHSVSLMASPRFYPSGRRRALLVGINYNNTPAQLNGCVTDVSLLYRRLTVNFGFQPSDFVILADEPTDGMTTLAKASPTRSNILHWLNWLVSDTRPGDSLWFSFSGHGAQITDLDGDEADNLDEVILPLDYDVSGFIVDDQLKEIASGICVGSRLTVLIDSCHSGTALDLPFQYDVFNSLTRSKSARARGAWGNLMNVFNSSSQKRTTQYARLHRASPPCGEILLFSGCKDNQKSADTPLLAGGGVSTGAMTFAMYDALQHYNPGAAANYSYLSLLRAMRDKLLANQMTQTPQFSTSCLFDLHAPFVL